MRFKAPNHTIAQQVAYAAPKRVGWSSNGDHPMSHDKPLTESQFLFLLHCGVLRTDEEVEAADKREREQWTPQTTK